jgi:hypothetical protein
MKQEKASINFNLHEILLWLLDIIDFQTLLIYPSLRIMVNKSCKIRLMVQVVNILIWMHIET